MRVIVPFAVEHPKTRLAAVLGPEERSAFARTMLRDVLDAIRAAGHEPVVLATAPIDPPVPTDVRIEVDVDERPLTPAVNGALAAIDGPVAVVVGDLALATPRAVGHLCAAPGEVVLAPGRGGGTNALVVRHPDFRVDYHGASYLDHLRIASEVGASVRELDSMRLATDVDEPADLTEVLIHGDGAAVEWLREAGFRLDREDGRVTVAREG